MTKLAAGTAELGVGTFTKTTSILNEIGLGRSLGKIDELASESAVISYKSTINKVEFNARVDDGMQFVQYQKNGSWDWPKNLGFEGNKVETTIPVGTKLDRIGEPSGSFLSPAGTPYEYRALAPTSASSKIYEYEVLKPLPTFQGKVAPAFGQPGGGIQILPNFSQRVDIQWLIDNGYLKQIK